MEQQEIALGPATPEDFRAAFRRHPAGVVVVTADAGAGPAGLTATSLVSVSLDPPMVSLAIAESASAWPALSRAGSFVVNLLGQDHPELAQHFATRGIDRFAPPTRWVRLTTGEPALLDAASWLRCATDERVRVGDHWLVLGRVTAARVDPEAAPLVYHDRRYHGLGEHTALEV
ncbi:flavin reductase (DIM6/NTAB) family NADH-FMN oxidoreductase RutF [Motilibacter rhizosphaerae]|uniref:Flavin reductase (DIM6/NTAB) family NADH-FMN oxidoreductase RutF n=1 Tax=Motilibacter rhizosphaerae TaxID=598652 RepID=A0A4Q7NTD1_9ACTN|nr:flavin reductase family protein [Motilibacter rhizosphaerae]RZS90058.1 flavin reductase (DIM6/NTAB) family NADH-FMN oxidoreductase RutF [Motilibacter rhizosphaerae]